MSLRGEIMHLGNTTVLVVARVRTLFDCFVSQLGHGDFTERNTPKQVRRFKQMQLEQSFTPKMVGASAYTTYLVASVASTDGTYDEVWAFGEKMFTFYLRCCSHRKSLVGCIGSNENGQIGCIQVKYFWP